MWGQANVAAGSLTGLELQVMHDCGKTPIFVSSPWVVLVAKVAFESLEVPKSLSQSDASDHAEPRPYGRFSQDDFWTDAVVPALPQGKRVQVRNDTAMCASFEGPEELAQLTVAWRYCQVPPHERRTASSFRSGRRLKL